MVTQTLANGKVREHGKLGTANRNANWITQNGRRKREMQQFGTQVELPPFWNSGLVIKFIKKSPMRQWRPYIPKACFVQLLLWPSVNAWQTTTFSFYTTKKHGCRFIGSFALISLQQNFSLWYAVASEASGTRHAKKQIDNFRNGVYRLARSARPETVSKRKLETLICEICHSLRS